MLNRFLLLILFSAALTGCASLPDWKETFLGQANQKTEKPPLYKYRADMQITVGGKKFDGVAVADLNYARNKIELESRVKMDRLEIMSCRRHQVFENVGGGWFSSSGTKMSYEYVPNNGESEAGCPVYFQAFAKNLLTSWGMIFFRTSETLLADVGCNGEQETFKGVSICQTKAGLKQSFAFAQPVNFELGETCAAANPSDRLIEIAPKLGFCEATFDDGRNFHRLILLGYESVLVRVD
jgi:hypothetical protein